MCWPAVKPGAWHPIYRPYGGAWLEANLTSKVPIPPPPRAGLEARHLPLLAALIPETIVWHHQRPAADTARVLVACT